MEAISLEPTLGVKLNAWPANSNQPRTSLKLDYYILNTIIFHFEISQNIYWSDFIINFSYSVSSLRSRYWSRVLKLFHIQNENLTLNH